MDDVLAAALAPVLRDLRRTGAPTPTVQDRPWTDDPATPSAMLGSPDGSAMGVSVKSAAPPVERVASAADQVQEWAIEELWRDGRSNWPPCPRHPAGHPMRASVSRGVAGWRCPADDVVVAAIGELAS